MDEVLFHLSQRFDNLQVHFHSATVRTHQLLQNSFDQIHHSASNFLSSHHGQTIKTKLGILWQGIQNLVASIKRIATQYNFNDLYNNFMFFLATKVTRTGIYIGIIGFAFGGLVGTLLGLSWQRRTTAPHHMRAVVCNSYGGLEAVTMIDDASAPVIVAPDELIVQVKAASIDPVDMKITNGYGRVLRKHLNRYNVNVKNEFPITLGRDCAGIISEIGYKVTRFEVGDEVWCAVPYWCQGAMSEYVVVKDSLVSKKPKNVGFEGASTVPFSAMIAWNALDQAGLSPTTTKGKRILIHVGSNSVGCLLVQLVRQWGGHITTTVAGRAALLIQMLGADDIVVYTDKDFERELKFREKFDVVINVVGSVLHESCLKFCKEDGIVVTAVASPIASDAHGLIFGSLYFYSCWIRLKHLIFQKTMTVPSSLGSINISSKVLDEFRTLIEEEKLQPVIDKIFPPHEAELAFHYADSAEAIGKTVIRFRFEGSCRCGHIC